MTKHSAVLHASATRRFAVLAGSVALAGCLALAGCGTSNDAATTSADDASGTASVQQVSDEAAQISTEVVVTDARDADAQEVLFDAAVDLDEGASVLDALEATGLDCVVTESEYGPYVESIASVANGDAGETSGWTYTVNGEYGTTSADEYILADGDEVAWSYLVF
jgi:hypothetical protein